MSGDETSFQGRKPSFRTPKLCSQSTISPFPRFSNSSVSLDYANRWRGSNTESTCHGDRKLCSTRRENSSPGRRYGCINIADIVTPSGIGIAYVITIRNLHFETVDMALILRNSVMGPKFCRR
ncbi:hypothetical protein Taro_018440, partial [Colocasia esculenta]|nr:hypothetical protein [Colocasia esculenta]